MTWFLALAVGAMVFGGHDRGAVMWHIYLAIEAIGLFAALIVALYVSVRIGAWRGRRR